MLANSPRPIIFGHRGVPVRAPENTLASFRLALEEGAPAIELDAKLTADQQVVVLHDPTLERTTNGHGSLAEHTLAEIRDLDAGRWFSAGYVGEKIPTLNEVFELVGRKAIINVELTNYSTPTDSLVEKVVELVRLYHLENDVIFSSFYPENLVRSRALIPEVPLGMLVLEGRLDEYALYKSAHPLPHEALNPDVNDVTEELIRSQHQQGKSVNVWTVNQPSKMRQLITWEVDGIITDDPALAVKVLGEMG